MIVTNTATFSHDQPCCSVHAEPRWLFYFCAMQMILLTRSWFYLGRCIELFNIMLARDGCFMNNWCAIRRLVQIFDFEHLKTFIQYFSGEILLLLIILMRQQRDEKRACEVRWNGNRVVKTSDVSKPKSQCNLAKCYCWVNFNWLNLNIRWLHRRQFIANFASSLWGSQSSPVKFNFHQWNTVF